MQRQLLGLDDFDAVGNLGDARVEHQKLTVDAQVFHNLLEIIIGRRHVKNDMVELLLLVVVRIVAAREKRGEVSDVEIYVRIVKTAVEVPDYVASVIGMTSGDVESVENCMSAWLPAL